jgi:hypothetical protein
MARPYLWRWLTGYVARWLMHLKVFVKGGEAQHLSAGGAALPVIAEAAAVPAGVDADAVPCK